MLEIMQLMSIYSRSRSSCEPVGATMTLISTATGLNHTTCHARCIYRTCYCFFFLFWILISLLLFIFDIFCFSVRCLSQSISLISNIKFEFDDVSGNLTYNIVLHSTQHVKLKFYGIFISWIYLKFLIRASYLFGLWFLWDQGHWMKKLVAMPYFLSNHFLFLKLN